MDAYTSIAICVATYLRPQGLERLLDSLRELNVGELTVHLIVADNDPNGSARPIVQDQAARFPFPVRYVMEPARGISSVRNRLVAEARSLDAEFLAFVDDDETVDSQWLLHATTLMLRSPAEVGAVVSSVTIAPDIHAPSYVKAWFARRSHPQTGTIVGSANTGGSLYRLSALNEIPGPFDERLNLAGGGDGLLSRQLSLHGYIFVASAEALLTEHFPRARSTAKWLMQRRFRVGLSQARIATWTGTMSRLRLLQRSIFAVLRGLAMLSVCWFIDWRLFLNGLTSVAQGAGLLIGTISKSIQFEEYKTTHGN